MSFRSWEVPFSKLGSNATPTGDRSRVFDRRNSGEEQPRIVQEFPRHYGGVAAARGCFRRSTVAERRFSAAEPFTSGWF